ncbi:MAG: hypothetical protein AAFY59_13185, partial [Pseudomonadota bacterium]
MVVLQALLAFSITMIVFSTFVVAIVEVIHAARGMRKRHLTYLVGAVFDEFIWPEFQGHLQAGEGRLLRTDPTDPFTAGEMGAVSRHLSSMAEWAPNRVSREVGGRKVGLALPSVWWLVAVVILALLFLLGWVIPLLLILPVLYLAIDWAKEPDRFNYPGLPLGDTQQLALLRRLDERDALRGKAGRTPAEEARLEALEADAALNDAALVSEHTRLTKRRVFIAEIAKISKSVAADPGRAKTAFAEHMTAVEFMGQLARTEFGVAIRDAAKDDLDVVVTEIARRFDAIGHDTLVTFRERSRWWSVAAAFALALVANVNVITLIEVYYRNPDVANQIQETYAPLLEEQAAREVTPEAARVAEDAETAVAELRQQVADTEEEIRREINQLVDLGAPVGWSRFPICAVDQPTLMDRGCEAAFAEQRALQAEYSGVAVPEFRASDAESGPAAPLSYAAYFAAFAPDEMPENTLDRVVENAATHWQAV